MGQLNTFAQGLKKMFRQSGAQTKLDKAARGTTGTDVKIGTTTPIRGQLPAAPTTGRALGSPVEKSIVKTKPQTTAVTTTKPSALGSPDTSVKRAKVFVDDPMAGRKLPAGSENLNVGRKLRRAAATGVTAAVASSAGGDTNRDKASGATAPTPPAAPTPEEPKTTPKAPETTPKAPETTPKAPETTPKAPEVKAPTVTTATPKRSAQTGDKKKDMKTWADANPRLAKVAALRKKGASRAEINMAMYDKGSKPYEAAKKQLGK